MKKELYLSLVVAGTVGLGSVPALAFQETISPKGSLAPARSSYPSQQSSSAGDAALNGIVIEQEKEDRGIKIKIPGIGTIGHLPKLDFDLKLLYSDSDDTLDDKSDPVDELRIRGQVKHNF